MTLYRFEDHAPDVHPSAWVAPGAHVVGQVHLGEGCSVWFGAVIRGDNEPIRIGARTNIQESAVLHVDTGQPLTLGTGVTVGHQAMLHGCTIGDGSLIGIQAVVLNGAVIGKGCLVGAGALVTEGKTFPDRSLIIGSPAKAVRTLSDEEVQRLELSAASYVAKAAAFARTLQSTD